MCWGREVVSLLVQQRKSKVSIGTEVIGIGATKKKSLLVVVTQNEKFLSFLLGKGRSGHHWHNKKVPCMHQGQGGCHHGYGQL